MVATIFRRVDMVGVYQVDARVLIRGDFDGFFEFDAFVPKGVWWDEERAVGVPLMPCRTTGALSMTSHRSARMWVGASFMRSLISVVLPVGGLFPGSIGTGCKRTE